MPAEAEEKIEEYMAELNEQVAETDEALMEKFFMEEPFTAEELLTGIKAGIRDRSVTPVFCGCAYTVSARRTCCQPRQVRAQPLEEARQWRRLTKRGQYQGIQG